jgi:hypothetical protein
MVAIIPINARIPKIPRVVKIISSIFPIPMLRLARILYFILMARGSTRSP